MKEKISIEELYQWALENKVEKYNIFIESDVLCSYLKKDMITIDKKAKDIEIEIF